MSVFRPADVPLSDSDPDEIVTGRGVTRRLSDAGGLTGFGMRHQRLEPGARTSDRHWHEQEDEMLYVLSGEVTVVENDGPHRLGAGDFACWPAGVDNGHTVENRSASPCSFLVVGSRPAHDVCHYPDHDRQLEIRGREWRIVRTSTGQVIEGEWGE